MPTFTLRTLFIATVVLSVVACISLDWLLRKPDPKWTANVAAPLDSPLTIELAEIVLNHQIPIQSPEIDTPIKISSMKKIKTWIEPPNSANLQSRHRITYRCEARSISNPQEQHVLLIEHQGYQ